jgi:hypothetical protein
VPLRCVLRGGLLRRAALERSHARLASGHTARAGALPVFAIEPRYRSLRSDWTPIAERLKKLNDTRVRLAHYALISGKGIEALIAGEDLEVIFPSLQPNQFDTRTKTKKQTPLRFEEVVVFIQELASVAVRLAELVERAAPIYLEPQRRLIARVRDLQRKAGEKVFEPKHPRPDLS